MTDVEFFIDGIGDAWTDSTRTGLNTGSTAWVHVRGTERYGWLKPPLQSMSGLTVLAAPFVGRVGPGHVAQTYTFAPITERWSPGRVTHATRPAVDTGAAVSVAVGALPDGGLVEVDLAPIVASVAAGAEWHGLRISTDSTTDGQKFYATDSGKPAWEWTITLSDSPEQPRNLRPDGGSVGGASPIVAWDEVDIGDETMTEFVVQVDTPVGDAEPDDVAPDYDSGWVASTDPQFDLDGEHSPAGAGPHYWRVKTKDATGVESEWSDWAFFTVADLPVLVIDSPTGAFGDISPTLLAHLEEGGLPYAGEVAWQAMVTGPKRSDVRAQTGLRTGAIAWEIPERNNDGRRVIREDEPGWLYLRAFDEEDRAVAVGQTPYLEAWVPLEFDDDLGVTAPTSLKVEQEDDGDPRMRWTFAMPEAPVAVGLQANGVTVQRVELADLTVSSGFYSVRDNGGVPPLRPTSLAVVAFEDGKRSSKASHPVTSQHEVNGLWLLPDDAEPILLDGTAVGDFGFSDRVATYTPLVGPEVEIVYDYEGMKGTFAGSIDDRDGDVWEKLARIETLKASRNRVVRMVWGSHSIMARISDLSPVAAEEITATNPRHNVRFRFVEVG